MKRILISALAAAVPALAGCASTGIGGRRLSRSADVSAAEGTVKFKRIGGDDTRITLDVKNLEEPEELLQPGYTYVAWVRRSPEEPPQNVGALCLDDKLDGTLRTETPLRRFELFVTAEATSDAAEPTGERLLWASRE